MQQREIALQRGECLVGGAHQIRSLLFRALQSEQCRVGGFVEQEISPLFFAEGGGIRLDIENVVLYVK